ncbi:HEPN domain-containing protein [candidate division KSB3 bacterium]|uniref:HEPN domain-containing protein n=1 Tax=candidate division KSB3 bacterium TaxID=2044937 RepID=A0A9D5Q560_9BACT|nr:HEPN domain-containing protein [candidate division KSB3 bacterium]MBD3324479.1 HEPN domain-containing protein [candidate division KSB3 bacterium]
MKNETHQWLEYAEQDYQAAQILLQSHLYNPCLYHVQQSIEKYLKAIIVEYEFGFQRTHSIRGLVNIVSQHGVLVEIAEDDIDLIDAIYMPVRYPVGSALPLFEPNQAICQQCLRIADRLGQWLQEMFRG